MGIRDDVKKLFEDGRKMRETGHGLRGNDPKGDLTDKGKYARTRGNDPKGDLTDDGKYAQTRGNDPKGDLVNKGIEPGE